MFGPGHRLVKKNLAGRGLTNIEKHCSRICSALWSLLYRSSAAKPPPCSNVPTPNPTLRQSNLTNIPWAATLISAIFCTGQWPGGWGSWAVWTDPSVAICRGCNRTTCLFYTILQDEQFKLFKVQWITSNPMTQLLLFFTAGMQSDMWDLKCGGAETAPPPIHGMWVKRDKVCWITLTAAAFCAVCRRNEHTCCVSYRLDFRLFWSAWQILLKYDISGREIVRRIYVPTQEEGRWHPRWNSELYNAE